MMTTLMRGRVPRAAIRNASTVLMIGGLLALGGFAATANTRRAPSTEAPKDWRDAKASANPAQNFSGIASFYGKNDEPSGETASGQKFDEDAMTAAHRSLPFGTRLK
ncbi:MAG: septal ring lytic transglycosylase RlpA family lipoprotein, partial [Rhizobiales bacterium]|nr:septal ring lytic transglycosylase RlpA family lipoprotein [Hyphomicrobiales bacterium]